MDDVRFFAICDADYFLGLTATMQAQAPVWLRPGALNAAAMHALCAATSIRRGHAHAWKAGSRLKQRARALAGAVR